MSARMKRRSRCGRPVSPGAAGAPPRRSRRYAGFIHGLLALGTALGVEGTTGGVPVAAQAAGTAEDVRTLTLEEALTLASEHNPNYRKALNRSGLTGARLRQGWAAFLPNVTAGYNTGQSFRREAGWRDFSGGVVVVEEPMWVTTSDANLGLTASFDLLDGGRRFNDYRRIRAEVRQSRLGEQVELDRIVASVQRQFLALQRQKAQLEVEEELVATGERDLDVIRRRFELALIGRTDLLAAQLDQEGQRARLRDAEGRVGTAKIALRLVIGDPSLEDLDVEEGPPEPFDPASMDLEGLVRRALADNPQIRSQEAQVQMSSANLRDQGASRWPQLTASSSWGRSTWGDGRSAVFDMDSGDINGSARWSFSFNIPIFDRFQRSYSTASARVNLLNANEDLRQARLQLEYDVRSRYVELTTAWRTLQRLESALEFATERLEIMRQQYLLANVDIEPLRTATNQEATARRDVVDQRFEFALALLGLYETAGIVGVEAGIRPGPEVN